MAKKQPTFEEALKQLEALAEQIERGQIGLEESIVKYEQGMKLVAQCRSILNRAEQRVQKLQPATGQVSAVNDDSDGAAGTDTAPAPADETIPGH